MPVECHIRGLCSRAGFSAVPVTRLLVLNGLWINWYLYLYFLGSGPGGTDHGQWSGTSSETRSQGQAMMSRPGDRWQQSQGQAGMVRSNPVQPMVQQQPGLVQSAPANSAFLTAASNIMMGVGLAGGTKQQETRYDAYRGMQGGNVRRYW